MGDFYEMFGQDALIASKVLNIALTARNKGTENEIPMCGIPYHALNAYLFKLTKANKNVAICEQLTEPSSAGLVERDVVRVVTPGTSFDDTVVLNNENNYIVAIKKFTNKNIFGLALADLSTGEFKLCEIDNKDVLYNEIFKINPREIIIENSLATDPEMEFLLKEFYYNIFDLAQVGRFFQAEEKTVFLEDGKGEDFLKQHFNVKTLSGFGVDGFKSGIETAAFLLFYLYQTQKVALTHINVLSLYNYHEYMFLDRTTIKNLELLQNSSEGDFKGSLLWVIDKTVTAMGGRLLKRWLLRPLLDKQKIDQRLDSVACLVGDTLLRENLTKNLKNVSDLERLVAKIGCLRVNARDLIFLKTSLEIIPVIKELVKGHEKLLLSKLGTKLNTHTEIIEIINSSINPESGISIMDGNIIKDGYNQEVDELRFIMNSGKEWIEKLKQQEIERTGINTLKIKFNRVFGYYIEISKSNLSSVPDNYVRKQTLVNAERFITPELKEFEEKVLTAQEKIKKLEFELFENIRSQIGEHLKKLQKTAYIIAYVDCLLGFSKSATENNYYRPNVNENNEIKVIDGRHPVIEKINEETYIPNDIILNNKEHNFLLITGPNMSGKSSYLRQTAVIVLMAHIGCFVSAKEADICLTDRIFTRVGASDNLVRGESTFMVEMQEASLIINNATEKSLVILDELGRGTSTYDGLSIAWAVSEYIHDKIKCKTLFATHYHELIEVVGKMKGAQNYSIAVKETDSKVVFLRKVIKGGINKSYGVEVAKLAGLPQEIISRAMDLLQYLETEFGDKNKPVIQKNLPLVTNNNKNNPLQTRIIKELKNIEVNNLTPLEALKKLDELVRLTVDMKI